MNKVWANFIHENLFNKSPKFELKTDIQGWEEIC